MIFFSDRYFFWGGEMAFFIKIFSHFKEGHNLELWNFWDEQFIYQNKRHIGRLVTLKVFFRLDHFWGKIAFLKKNFVVGDFEEGIKLEPWNLVGWSHILGAPDYWKKFTGEWFLRKLWPFFENWTLPFF